MEFKFKKKVLKNGMTILFEKRDIPVATAILAARSGTVNEDSNEKGIFHFIEHMLYKGTKKRNSFQISKEIEEKGGILNGFTSDDAVAFWCKMPSEHLEIGLDVLGDIMNNSVFDSKEFEKERQVILEELKMYKDNPIRHSVETTYSCLYEKPFGKPDDEKTMNSITKENLIKRFEDVFQPDNLILCVVGNAKFEKVVDFASKNFGNKKSKIDKFKIEKKTGKKTEKRKGIDQASMTFSFHAPEPGSKKSYAARVLNCLMCEGMSSRLFAEIREKRNLAYTVHGFYDGGKGFGHIIIYAGSRKENTSKIKKLILKEFENVSKNLTEDELEEVKKKIVGNHKLSMEDTETQAANLVSFEIKSKAEDFYEFEKNIKSVSLKDVKDLAKINDYGFFVLMPE